MINWRYPLISFLLRLQGRQIMSRYRRMKQISFAPPEFVQTTQRLQLADLLRHAEQGSPYYREIFQGHHLIDKNGEADLHAFSRLPLLDKSILRNRFDDLQVRPLPPKTYVQTSGGSTGEPVRFLHESDSWDYSVAGTLFFFQMAGKEMGEREVKLWGSEHDIFEGGIGLKAKLENYLYNRMLLNSFQMSPAVLRSYVGRINRFRPAVIWTYVDSAYELARFVERESLPFVSPKAIIVTAGTLHPPVRETIERVLGSPVLNQYGSREVGVVACECPQRQGLHLLEFCNLVEVLRSDGTAADEGEIGEVVVTSLVHRAMPLIRYRIGDMAVRFNGTCRCGRSLRLLKTVSGRVTDHFRKRDGTLVHGEYFTHLFYNLPGIEKFKIIQEEFDHIHILIIPSPEFDFQVFTRHEGGICAKVQLVMGESCKIDFKVVETIPSSPSGKYLYTESRVPE
jgi:phenylacetate-CoA ligase